MIHGMLFRAQTAVVWRELPERYGRWKTRQRPVFAVVAQRRLDRAGGKVRVLTEATDEPDHDLAREVSVDSSIVRAHRHTGTPPAPAGPPPRSRPGVSRCRESGHITHLHQHVPDQWKPPRTGKVW